MWEFTSGIPPFKYEEHDFHLSISICEGERPGIIENTPKCFVDLMEKCWDTDPENRPTIKELEYKISEWIRCINRYYALNRDGSYGFAVPGINSKLENDMLEFVKASNTLVQEQTNITNISFIQSHSQAYSASHKPTSTSDHSECMIVD
ncbi:kinase-like domain-containing protein [Rhizophagus clarus]|uniref:Kinase-like domain-containing protein n=1 Tax=Rhizophagus clarus TaxID=94130 RepID=A0A8H3M3X1_9GLOM|nr:kinase-like domain-containing protein [Rhizophagus clarus]